jgi:hypothetical protein
VPSDHCERTQSLSRQLLSAAASGKPVKFRHGSTNSTREGDDAYTYVDVSDLSHILHVDVDECYVDSEPNVPMDLLVETTLQHGLLPLVVMEFPGITIGGAIEGGALESSSFRNGQFSDSCLEYEVILSNGVIEVISPECRADIFYGIHGSYGSLCLLTKVRLRLIPAKKFVNVDYEPYDGIQALLAAMMRKLHDDVDYLEAIVYSEKSAVLISGKRSEDVQAGIQTFTRATDPWFYSHVRQKTMDGCWRESIPIRDHLFRYNRGTYWMGEYIFSESHIPHNRFTQWLQNPFLNTRKLYECMHVCRAEYAFFIQDFYVPIGSVEELLAFSERECGIYPVWLCPVRPTRNPEPLSPHYNDATMLVDVGIWGRNNRYLSDRMGMNKKFEKFVRQLGGRKMLYAQQYYTQEDFWDIYDKDWYDALRKNISAEEIFPGVYEKTHVYKMHDSTMLRGAGKLFMSFLKGKNLNA